MYLIEQELRIDERIYSVRGMQVMIDRDLAELYEVETDPHPYTVKAAEYDRFQVVDEEGNQTAAPDGDYTLENGNVVKVAEGKVSEIVEAEPVAEEETPAEEAMNDNEGMTALKAENESLKAEVESLKKQIAELSAQPLAKPAHDVVTTSQTFEKTGDKRLDRLAKVLAK